MMQQVEAEGYAELARLQARRADVEAAAADDLMQASVSEAGRWDSHPFGHFASPHRCPAARGVLRCWAALMRQCPVGNAVCSDVERGASARASPCSRPCARV